MDQQSEDRQERNPVGNEGDCCKIGTPLEVVGLIEVISLRRQLSGYDEILVPAGLAQQFVRLLATQPAARLFTPLFNGVTRIPF